LTLSARNGLEQTHFRNSPRRHGGTENTIAHHRYNRFQAEMPFPLGATIVNQPFELEIGIEFVYESRGSHQSRSHRNITA
jgi:hypothetical protein